MGVSRLTGAIIDSSGSPLARLSPLSAHSPNPVCQRRHCAATLARIRKSVFPAEFAHDTGCPRVGGSALTLVELGFTCAMSVGNQPHASLARPVAQSRRCVICSCMVRARGTVAATALKIWSVSKAFLAANASNMALMTACSSSAPLKPSVTWANCGRSNVSATRPRRRKWTARISNRSGSVGRSTKKISSNRPLRRSSGGRCPISLAVATTNTGESFSANQVSRVPKTRAAVPPFEAPPP